MKTTLEKILKHREYQSKYKASIKGKKTEEKYRKTYKFKISNEKSRLKKRDKMIIYHLVERNIKIGKVLKKKCQICGDAYSVAHHDDYSKPLEVKWFCRRHHAEYHKKIKEL